MVSAATTEYCRGGHCGWPPLPVSFHVISLCICPVLALCLEWYETAGCIDVTPAL
jgi:hypothetical protein